MPTYNVTLIYDASETITVEADSVDDAIAKAHEEAQAHLCHQCSNHLELGDAYDEIVEDEDGNVVKDTAARIEDTPND